MKEQKVTIGIIGCGVIAPTHAASLAELPDVAIKWCCDLLPEKAEKLRAQFHIERVTADYREVLNDPEVDLVTIGTDHASHSEIAVAAMRAGKHVVCEKALSSSHAKVEAMTAEHLFHPELCFSGIFQHRFEPTNRYLKQLIAEGRFGAIQTVAMNVSCLRTAEYYQADPWRGTRACEGGGVLINQAIHHIDLMRYFFGEVEAVSAVTANRTHEAVIEVEDAAAIALKFRSGTLATITATSSSAGMPWRNLFAITGTEGYLEYIDMQPGFVKFRDETAEAAVRQGFADCKLDPALRVAKSYYGGGHPAQMRDIIAAIREHRAPYVTGEDAAATAHLVLSCYDAHKFGGWIRL